MRHSRSTGTPAALCQATTRTFARSPERRSRTSAMRESCPDAPSIALPTSHVRAAIGEIVANCGYQPLKRPLLLWRDALDQVHDRTLNRARWDAREGAQQAQCVRRVEKAEDCAGIFRARVGRAEKERHRDVECFADAHQPPGPDAVHALLVFLHLLERHAEQVAEFGLRHALGHPPRADALPDLDIVRRG